MRHRCAAEADKTYEKFSRIIIELANEKRYDSLRAKNHGGQKDMDCDPVEEEQRDGGEKHPDYGHPGEQVEHSAKEWAEYEIEL